MSKLNLELETTAVEVGGRPFTLRELPGKLGPRFFQVLHLVAKAQKGINEAEAAGQETEKLKQEQEKLNLEMWQLMLHPADDLGPVTAEFVDDYTNSRVGEAVFNEMLRLNRFDEFKARLEKEVEKAQAAAAEHLADSPPPVAETLELIS